MSDQVFFALYFAIGIGYSGFRLTHIFTSKKYLNKINSIMEADSNPLPKSTQRKLYIAVVVVTIIMVTFTWPLNIIGHFIMYFKTGKMDI